MMLLQNQHLQWFNKNYLIRMQIYTVTGWWFLDIIYIYTHICIRNITHSMYTYTCVQLHLQRRPGLELHSGGCSKEVFGDASAGPEAQ